MKKIFSIMLIAMAVMTATSCLEEEEEKKKLPDVTVNIKGTTGSVPVSVTVCYSRINGTSGWGG